MAIYSAVVNVPFITTVVATLTAVRRTIAPILDRRTCSVSTRIRRTVRSAGETLVVLTRRIAAHGVDVGVRVARLQFGATGATNEKANNEEVTDYCHALLPVQASYQQWQQWFSASDA